MEILFKDECYKLIGAAIEVQRELGNGLLEPIYQEALERELAFQKIPFEAQPLLKVFYKGVPLDKKYYADIIAYKEIIIELKAPPMAY